VEVTGEPFANEGSLLLRGRNGQVARSSTTIFLEQSQTRPYMQGLVGDAAGCASRLAEAWLDETIAFTVASESPAIAEESVLVTNSTGAAPAAAIFFRREEAIGAVLVVGEGSQSGANELAKNLDQQIIQKFQELAGG
jgi:hypothetical protein